jgi:assimilatory nitrate reductase catalytic subunit
VPTRGMKLIVADPRRTETAEMADLFLPIQPGTDVALFHGMLHVMLAEGHGRPQAMFSATPRALSTLRTVVSDYAGRGGGMCGIPGGRPDHGGTLVWRTHAHLVAVLPGAEPISCGTDKNAALINLHLATGQIGRPGAGPFSLTGQPNAMGGREVGGMANLLSCPSGLAQCRTIVPRWPPCGV